MDQLCAHVILLPVKSMHTSPICCSSQADRLALCTHKQTAHFPDIRDCFQSERQSLGSFTQKEKKKSAGGRQTEKKKKPPVPSSNLSVCALTSTCVYINRIRLCLCLLFIVANNSFKSHGFAMFSPFNSSKEASFSLSVKLVHDGLSRFLRLSVLLCW